jgi:uncharacterized protein (DUF1697 family)
MLRFIAFLRAINVGGHTIKMEALRQLFESFGFSNVETFIASGNVIFETSEADTTALETQIAAGLRQALSYEVATFIRTPAELAAIASCQPFLQDEFEAAEAFNVAFLSKPLDEASWQKLLALRTEIDNFACLGREVYWLCRTKQSQSTFSNAVLEKTLKIQSTLRGMNTVKKLAERYS